VDFARALQLLLTIYIRMLAAMNENRFGVGHQTHSVLSVLRQRLTQAGRAARISARKTTSVSAPMHVMYFLGFFYGRRVFIQPTRTAAGKFPPPLEEYLKSGRSQVPILH
jgi:hypothetical protein